MRATGVIGLLNEALRGREVVAVGGRRLRFREAVDERGDILLRFDVVDDGDGYVVELRMSAATAEELTIGNHLENASRAVPRVVVRRPSRRPWARRRP